MNRKPFVLVPVLALLCAWLGPAAQAQNAIYRCGNEYTNHPGDAKARGCRLVEGGNLTVIEGSKSRPAPAAANGSKPAGTTPRNGADKVDSAAQKARDADARAILEAELRKAEARVAELQAEYANGEPPKLGPEFRNHQTYLNRVAEIKERLDRATADVEGIQRELARLNGSAR